MTYRLLKVVCQAVLVSEDDSGELVETVGQPVPVPAAAWHNYPAKLAEQIAQLSNGKEPAP